jgi:type IV pilus assembly protein PilM
MLSGVKRLLDTDISSFFVSDKHLLGLDIGSSCIKVIQMKEAKGHYALQKFGVKPLEPGTIVDGTVMNAGKVVAAIKELMKEHRIREKRVATSISGHSVIVKKITLPSVPEEELETQVRLAAEQYIPFDINEVNLDFHVLNASEQADDGEPQMSLLLVAAKKDKVTELTELVRSAGLTPVVIDVDAFAIENMYDMNYTMAPDEITALVNIGASVMNVNIVKGGTCVFTRDISIGGNRYTEAIQHELGVPFDEAEAAKKGDAASRLNREAVTTAVSTVNTEVVSEVANSIDYFRTTNMDGEIGQVLLCGGCANVKGLSDELGQRLGVHVALANPFAEIDVTGVKLSRDAMQAMAPLAAVGVGLALRRPGDR